MRIGEALQISLNDIDLAKNPTRMTIRGEYAKNGDTRVVFITQEAKEAVEAWLQVRADWLKASLNRGRGLGIEITPTITSVAADLEY